MTWKIDHRYSLHSSVLRIWIHDCGNNICEKEKSFQRSCLQNGLGSPWTLKAMFLLYLKTTTIPNTNCTNSNNKYKTVPNTKVKACKWFGNDLDPKAIFLLYLKTIWSHRAFNLTFLKFVDLFLEILWWADAILGNGTRKWSHCYQKIWKR